MQAQAKILDLASLQGGVVTRDQAISLGFSPTQIDRRLATGRWQAVANGSYRLVSMPGRLNLARAAVAVLPQPVVSHYSAAAIHQIRSVPADTVSVTVAARTTHVFPGVQVFRTDDLAHDHIERRKDLPVTTLHRTVTDLASVLSLKHLRHVVDDLLADGRCEISGLTSVLESVARRGKPGVSKMRSVLEERSIVDENRSPLERAGLQLLVDGGFDGYRAEFPIPWAPSKRFDVAFPSEKIAIEWDSRRWHTLADAFQRDRERDRLAIENGWRVLRFTWHDVHESPNAVIETIRAVLGH